MSALRSLELAPGVKGQGIMSAVSAHNRLADLCYASLKLSGWAVVTASCVVATYAILFLMLGEFSVAGLVAQVDNFTSRYLAADAARQARFDANLAAASIALFVIIGFFRRHALLPLNACKKETFHDSR